MTGAAHFKRMVLRLPPSAADYNSVAVVAELARRCGLDLLGLFVRDEHLREVAAGLGSRELLSPGGGWQGLDVTRLDRNCVTHRPRPAACSMPRSNLPGAESSSVKPIAPSQT